MEHEITDHRVGQIVFRSRQVSWRDAVREFISHKIPQIDAANAAKGDARRVNVLEVIRCDDGFYELGGTRFNLRAKWHLAQAPRYAKERFDDRNFPHHGG